MSQHVGSFGFKLEIPVTGLSPSEDLVLRVVFERPDGTTFERTTDDDQIEVVDSVTANSKLLGVAILEGDFNQTGIYHYQVWDETAAAMVRSDVDAFFVEDSLAIVV